MQRQIDIQCGFANVVSMVGWTNPSPSIFLFSSASSAVREFLVF